MILKKFYSQTFLLFYLFLGFSCGLAQSSAELIKREADFSFIVTADMREFAGPRYQSPEYFMGACLAIQKVGKGAFMISPGDIDPPWYVRSTIDEVLGEDYLWFPVVGNHEEETRSDMEWIRQWGRGDIPYQVQKGPGNCEETVYSFNYRNAHFIAINQYCNGLTDTGNDAAIRDVLYQWLKADLEENDKPLVFVFGHEPIVVLPDIDNGRIRHLGDSLDEYQESSHRFQILLRKFQVKAYFCGHTHNASYANINGLWQFDAGHSRGLGDTGTRSTFIKVWVKDKQALVEFYRDDQKGGNYTLSHSVVVQ